MSKTNRIAILLDGTVPEDTITDFIDRSYETTSTRPKRKKKE